AGDDGIYCVDGQSLSGGAGDQPPSPHVVWHVEALHVDASPLVVGERLFVGSVVGTRRRDLRVVAVNTVTSQIAWQVDTPLPAPAAPAYAAGRVFFALGNGKMDRDADQPAGALW